MASRSQAFELASGELERASGLGRVAARGALAGVCARALFDPRRVSAGELRAVVLRLLAPELAKAGVKDAQQVCERLALQLAAAQAGGSDPESPDEVFARLIRR
jgi:hypothetical protein